MHIGLRSPSSGWLGQHLQPFPCTLGMPEGSWSYGLAEGIEAEKTGMMTTLEHCTGCSCPC